MAAKRKTLNTFSIHRLALDSWWTYTQCLYMNVQCFSNVHNVGPLWFLLTTYCRSTKAYSLQMSMNQTNYELFKAMNVYIVAKLINRRAGKTLSYLYVCLYKLWKQKQSDH